MPTGDNRFVVTRDVKAAVKGRELDILAALGIDWRNGNHISCPYADHADANPSWRWDLKKDIAYCTCINGPRKADGIFDVVAKVRALDFDAAKIIVAELLHRDDLIKTKGGAGEL